MKQAFTGLCTALVVCAPLVLGSPASAQFGEAAGLAEAMTPEYINRDIVLFSQGLDLDADQRVIVEGFYEDYRTGFAEGLEQMRNELTQMSQGLKANQDQKEVMKQVFAPLETWAKERLSLGEQFLENVQLILTDDQLAEWDSFRRMLTREKTMHKSKFSGENVNLFHVIRDLQLNKDEMRHVQPVLDQYEIALDEALAIRNNSLNDLNGDMISAMIDQDATKSLTVIEQQIGYRVGVRQVNDSYIEIIAGALPESKRDEFRQSALERGYPRAYRPTLVQNMYAAAMNIDGLDPEVLASIQEFDELYRIELADVNDALAEGIRAMEPENELYRARKFATRLGGEQPYKAPDPTTSYTRRRDSLEIVYGQHLRDLLTPEQFNELPGADRWLAREQQPTSPEKRYRPGIDDRREGAKSPGLDGTGRPKKKGEPKGMGDAPPN